MVLVRTNILYEGRLVAFLRGNHLSNSCRWRRGAKYHVQVLLFPCQPVSWARVLVGIISFVNCQPLLIYVLRRHVVPVLPAPSPPPALSCSGTSVSQNPLLQSLLVLQNNPFSLTSLPHRLLLAPGPLCQIGLFPRSSLPELHIHLFLLSNPLLPWPPAPWCPFHQAAFFTHTSADCSRPLSLGHRRLLQLLGLCCSLAFCHPAPSTASSSFKYLHLLVQTLFPRGEIFHWISRRLVLEGKLSLKKIILLSCSN